MSGPKIVFLDAATYGDISLPRFIKQWDCTIYPDNEPIRNLPTINWAISRSNQQGGHRPSGLQLSWGQRTRTYRRRRYGD